jgi:hypothetical protein
VRKHEQAVNAKREKPRFYTYEQWVERLHEIFAEYNAEPQEGSMLQGLSPDEAWEQFRKANDPPITFDPATRYRLSHVALRPKVNENGITITVGRQKFVYRDAETGKRIGEHVLAWFNSEAPDFLTVTDLNQTNPFTVERHNPLPAVDAPAELIKREMSKLKAHQAHVRTLHRTLKAAHETERRIMVADAQTTDLGRAIETQVADATTRKQERVRRTARLSRMAARAGVSSTSDDASNARPT